jgi:uncharacterized membrane protein
MWHTQDGMGWWIVFMAGFWLLFMASMIYLFLPAFTRSRGHDEGDALAIAKRRLARGEITMDQFLEIRRHLEAEGVVRIGTST